tara:strand:- start:364 stop:558 length:195 start_codon:yes stop_codon:yes gene_type:complete
MSDQKNNVKEKAKEVANNIQGKNLSQDEIKKMIENLNTQFQNYNTMAIKASGALEVLNQMLEKE